MFFKKTILKWLAQIIARLVDKYNIIYNKASSDYFQNETRCNGRINVNNPVFVKGGKYISVEEGFFANHGLRIECIDEYYGNRYTPNLTIGKNVSFGCNCHVGCINTVEIGKYVLCGSNVLIIDHSHGKFDISDKDIPWVKRALYSKGAIVIEDNVWLCDNVSVLPNVRIGKGSVVGAGSVVTKDIPPYSLAVGNPAKVIKQLEL